MPVSDDFDLDELLSYPTLSMQELQRPNLVYGAGNFGKNVCRCLMQNNLPVLGFLDRRAALGMKWQGVALYPPDWAGISAQQKAQTNVVIAIHNREVEILPIVAQLRQAGYSKFVFPVQFYDLFADSLGDAYWLTQRSRYAEWKQEIEAGDRIWADEISRANYRALLRFRLQSDFSALPQPDLQRQYFPADLPPWQKPLHYVDCGAYIGDTLINARQLGVEIESAMLFEPDLNHFRQLTEYLRREWRIPAFCWPCAVHSISTTLNFAADGAEGGKLVSGDSPGIAVVALDDVLQGYRPTLIKMDIEGSELAALQGARRLIAEHRPGLAICAYHKPEHLWQLGLFLAEWDYGYRFYLRLHGQNSFETVLYAIPM
jgi:FkbM family methyltransferase